MTSLDRPADPPLNLKPDSAGVVTDWQRLHPLSPLLRSGRFLVGILAVVVQQGVVQQSVLGGLAVLAVLVPLSLLSGYVSWRVTRYRLADGELQIDSGLLQRRQRRVPLVRLQSVDVVRPLVGRFLGLSEVRMEVVGSNDSEARLSFLGDEEAQRVRVELLSLTGAPREDDAPDAPADLPEERLLVKVPSRVLVTSILLGAPAITAVLVLVVLLATLVVSPTAAGGLLAVAVPLLLVTGQVTVRRLLSEYDFEVAESADGLRLRHGLLEKRAQTIPTGRVQTVTIVQPLLWRRRGWVRVEVDVAGYAGGGEEQQLTSALLPVAPREFAQQLVDRVLQGPLPLPVAGTPRGARWLAPLERSRLLLGLDDRFLVASSGWLVRRTDVVPMAKIQSLRSTQGPVQRRLGLATLHADSAGRRLSGLAAQHRAAPEVAALLDDLSLRARAARAMP